MSIFDREFWLDLKSDFTMNSLSRYKAELESGRCLFVNDGTTLFASKSQRTKDRLVGGLSELLSDGSYTYQDFGQKLSLLGNITMVINITSEAYQNYKDRLFGLTFSERFLTAHHVLTKVDKEAWVEHEEVAKRMHYGQVIYVEDIENKVEIPSKYLPIVKNLARDFSYASLCSPIGCQDLIKGTMRAHASLNRRSQACSDDLRFVVMTRKYWVNPFSPWERLIVKYRAQGLSVRQIVRKIGKRNYDTQVRRVIEKAELRGILDALSPQE
jgi:hypothetical protein